MKKNDLDERLRLYELDLRATITALERLSRQRTDSLINNINRLIDFNELYAEECKKLGIESSQTSQDFLRFARKLREAVEEK